MIFYFTGTGNSRWVAEALGTAFDEPLVSIADALNEGKNRGLGVLITDHNVRETLDIIDRAYILHGGAVLMEGTPAEIVASEEVRKVYLGDNFSI